MKIGSIVELVNDNWDAHPFDHLNKYPVRGKVYTVRDILEVEGYICIRLEEVINPTLSYGGIYFEFTFRMKRFRELLPPTDISELIEECLTEKV